ncbi:nucleotidyltransferase domain-containing protein [Pseudolabrys sp. FHR47]|uniref:nucleotidyltransferase domain-containing protein n=1 Tax=Pseudolabrys sp. FHR47 TaxID=2562284 RepID=UPI001FEEFE3D|nr:nucleotidyltransferase domain-containing protein [Pseudolabrys sp. FHR47]
MIFDDSLQKPILGIIIPKMGTMISAVGLSDALFSKVQQRVLALIFGHPGRSFYTSEIVRTVRSGVGAVERELARLRMSGLVTTERIGNQVHYRANVLAPVYEDLRGLVEKTAGLTDVIRRALEPFSQTVAAAFVFGSVAKGADTATSDVDLLVIGDNLDYAALYSALQAAEGKVARKINPLFVTQDDWRRKSAVSESVFAKIGRSPKVFLVGSEKVLRDGTGRARQSGKSRPSQGRAGGAR